MYQWQAGAVHASRRRRLLARRTALPAHLCQQLSLHAARGLMLVLAAPHAADGQRRRRSCAWHIGQHARPLRARFAALARVTELPVHMKHVQGLGTHEHDTTRQSSCRGPCQLARCKACGPPGPACLQSESTSSMKMTHGSWARAMSNRKRTSFSDSPLWASATPAGAAAGRARSSASSCSGQAWAVGGRAVGGCHGLRLAGQQLLQDINPASCLPACAAASRPLLLLPLCLAQPAAAAQAAPVL